LVERIPAPFALVQFPRVRPPLAAHGLVSQAQRVVVGRHAKTESFNHSDDTDYADNIGKA
ncbi:MAG: hypothetical protein FWF96_07130, partial [Kiritimatiellaeota bacterium]|nr:hypothetical protein [Kiritimatiellota bacterium]